MTELKLDRDKIRSILLDHGFKIPEGMTDLRPYVYEAAEALLAEVAAPALRIPEPMPEAEIFAAMDQYEFAGYDLARWAEAETLRRVRRANND